jgi:hypothetical protein
MDMIEPIRTTQPSEDNMSGVSDDTHDRTTADNIRPSSENRHTTARFGRMVATGVIGRIWVKVAGIVYL